MTSRRVNLLPLDSRAEPKWTENAPLLTRAGSLLANEYIIPSVTLVADGIAGTDLCLQTHCTRKTGL